MDRQEPALGDPGAGFALEWGGEGKSPLVPTRSPALFLGGARAHVGLGRQPVLRAYLGEYLPGFWDAWQCGPGTPMHADPVCEVW